MMLLGSTAAALALFLLALLLAGAGKRILTWLRFAPDHPLDALLFSLALGVTALELASCAGELLPNVRAGVIVSTAGVGLLGLFGVVPVAQDLRKVCRGFVALPRWERAAAGCLLILLALQGFAALAPIVGSDALHYHFTAQAHYLNYGFHANWELLHGFFCGLGHQLILVGIAFGSDQLATGMIFLGGMTATLATFCLARQFVGGLWPFAIALAFALTPVAFWQITSAGAPDIWMCAMLPLSVLAILPAARSQSHLACVLAGILAGACAGIKYTGITMAATLLLALLIETRSLQNALVFSGSAAAVGIWPYLRNLFWTGDPVFPFLWVRFHSDSGNVHALKSLLKDTGSSNPHPLGRVLHFPLFALTDYGYATWQFLGPLVLAFAPFALLGFRKTPLWRTVLLVWLIVSMAVGKTSGIPRFLLPVLPLALSASVGGVALFTRERFRFLRWVSGASLAGFCLAGFAAFVVYATPSWSVVAGRVSRDTYLGVHAPDYQRSLFVNQQLPRLAAGDTTSRALVFFRHLYYVRVPFMDGDPDDSWEMFPAALQSRQAWLSLFARNHVRWVVRVPDYPSEFAAQLSELEKEGTLKPCASGTVESIQGFRINGNMVAEPITILCVSP